MKMFLHTIKTVPYPALLLTMALALQMQPGLALPAGRRVRTPEAQSPPWCSGPYSLDREAVANRVRNDSHYIQVFTNILVDGHGRDQTKKISNLEGWNACSAIAVTPPEIELSTELQQIFNHTWKLQHLNHMYRLLVTMVKGSTTAADRAKLDMLNMLLVSLQGQLEMYLLAEQCSNEVAESAVVYQLNTASLLSSIGQGDCNTWSLLGRVVYDINTEAFEITNTFPNKPPVSGVTACSEAISALNALPSGMRCTNCSS